MKQSLPILLTRRDVIRTSAAAALGMMLSDVPAMAGPFTREEFDRLVPADKKLDKAWVDSLFAKGTPQLLEGEQLKYVGMPVGGIGAGQVYLSGDGRLTHWDIFNNTPGTNQAHYAKPFSPAGPFEQGFALNVGGKTVALDQAGFAKVTFRGEYPIGVVKYEDPAQPVAVMLEAFSPFIPLATDDSNLPATVMSYTLRNTSAAAIDAEIVGTLQNAACIGLKTAAGVLRNRIVQNDASAMLVCSVEAPADAKKDHRPDIEFENWSKPTYEGWDVEGTAFGKGPIDKKQIPKYQGDVGGDSPRVVNSHASADGATVGEKDKATGRLLSKEFTIEREFIKFFIGGGQGPEGSRHGLNLLIDGKSVLRAAGHNDNKMSLATFDVRPYVGKKAKLELIDAEGVEWCNIGLGRITFTDHPDGGVPLVDRPDFGTMALAVLGNGERVVSADETAGTGTKLVGQVGRKLHLEAGQSVTVNFVVAWHMPNLSIKGKLGNVGRYYASRFASADVVIEHVIKDFDRLATQTRLWRDTWYDSSLPVWFLDRTFLNTSILASSTTYLFKDRRYYGDEGVGCCPGTCGHVYHYAHAAGRLFPDLERDLRQRVDFGLAMKDDGAIRFRAEYNDGPAVDGQAGTILRALREHQMSAGDEFLKQNWPAIKKATNWLINKDENADGLIESNQHNTLDADWFGKVAWLSGLYLSSLSAAAVMADRMGDKEFAGTCRSILKTGSENLVRELFDGDYFINRVDPAHANAINSGTGCEIDQVFGQSWAFQVGLPRVLPVEQTRKALASLWRYNFAPDVGPYREANKPGRWYAMPGEAGLLMCTFPRKDWDFEKAVGKGHRGFAGYFNECMNGFEYQAAGHMIWEGMVTEGLAITRAVHDRYSPERRNPWNEVECGDHYARSMASYGVYLAACGFEYDGPAGRIGFAPRLTPNDFKCAFTAAQAWGTFSQKQNAQTLTADVTVRYGRLRLTTLKLGEVGKNSPARVSASVAGKDVPVKLSTNDAGAEIAFAEEIILEAGQTLTLSLTGA